MKFFRELLERFQGSKSKSLPTQIAENEPVSRFVFKGINVATGHIHPRAFLPGPTGRLSVFRIVGLLNQEIWKLAETNVAGTRTASLKGRADLIAKQVLELKLTLEADDKPLRHALVTNWPDAVDERLEIAQKLAKGAQLVGYQPVETPPK